RVDDPGRERLIPENRNGSLDDLTSARLSARAGIVLPTIDHPLRLRPAFRRDRACLAPAGARSRLLRGALGSLLGHGISPLLHRRRDTPARRARRGGGLAIILRSRAMPR